MVILKKTNKQLIKDLIIGMFNIKDAEITEKEDEMITRCMAYLESNKVLKPLSDILS